MSALIYRPNKRWRFPAALLAAAIIHLAAVGFATTHGDGPAVVSPTENGATEILMEPPESHVDPPRVPFDPLPAPPTIDQTFVQDRATPPPVRRNRSAPLVRPRSEMPRPSSISLSSAKVFALNAPPPEYPYEARRQKITGDGIVVMRVDPGSGSVTDASIAKSTGSLFLDNAAIAAFRRWRFKPGSVSTVTCSVTFTLSGASY
jgi:protein TonB